MVDNTHLPKTSYPHSSPCQSQSQSQSQSQTKNEPRSDGDGDGDKDELHTNCDEYNSTIATNTLHDRHQQPNIRCCHASIFDFDNDKDDTNDNICDRSSVIQRHRLSPVASSTATNINHVYYIPHCLTPQFTRSLQSWLTALPRHRSSSSSSSSSSQQTHNGKWTHLRHARRNVAVFDLTPSSTNNATSSPHTTAPPLLQQLISLLLSLHAFPTSHPPNHVLINEYAPSEGILSHTDGPVYLDRTATFSVGGGDVLFKFRRIEEGSAGGIHRRCVYG